MARIEGVNVSQRTQTGNRSLNGSPFQVYRTYSVPLVIPSDFTECYIAVITLPTTLPQLTSCGLLSLS